MQTLYQSLVAVNPVTLIAQICNLFIQLFFVKKFFLDKIRAILDRRREAADRQLADARAARSEADAIRARYEQNMRDARTNAEQLLAGARQEAAARGEEIIRQAQNQAVRIREKASADILQEKKKAIRDAKNEISDMAVTMARKVLGDSLSTADQEGLVDSFIDGLDTQT